MHKNKKKKQSVKPFDRYSFVMLKFNELISGVYNMEHWDKLQINEKGHLLLGRCDTVELAKKFGTPLYVMEEDKIRDICKSYYKSLKSRNINGMVAYANKAFCNTAMCKIVEQEGLGLDVVSGGEIYTALNAGFPMEKVYFHGNGKSYDELNFAVQSGIGCIVLDNFHEISMLESICALQGKTQRVMVRIKPCIEAHTHDYIKTARDDAKFGFGINDGDGMKAVKQAFNGKNITLAGIHCHIGSQIFELEPFKMAVDVMLNFVKAVREETGFEIPEINFGGGYGIHYLKSDDPLKPWEYVETMLDELKKVCSEKGIKVPRFVIEPGRSICGEAGTTLYTVQAIKEIPGILTYANVDGSLADNPRPALYQAKYTCVVANKVNAPQDKTMTIAGRSCESSDLLIKNAAIADAKEGDILAVFSTGAYNYSMASNYNRLPIPAVVLVKDGKAELMVKRQSYEDLVKNDTIPSWL